MKQTSFILACLLFCLFSACDSKPFYPNTSNNDGFGITNCQNASVPEEKIYKKDGRTYLWAGQDSTTHFDITGWGLDVCQLVHHFYHRESYDALITPLYSPIADDLEAYVDHDKVIVVHGATVTKIYPYLLMSFHEAINDVIDGEPIMVAYCVLADLAAVYTRNYCGQTFTFGVSGYTYADPYIWNGLNGFVLWDRETESLWWPQIDVAVSGKMNGVHLEKHPTTKWEISTWGEVKNTSPNAQVLQLNQSLTPPESWPAYDEEDLDCN